MKDLTFIFKNQRFFSEILLISRFEEKKNMERDKETEKEREKEKRSRTIRDEATAYAEGNEFRLSSASSQLIANNPTN